MSDHAIGVVVTGVAVLFGIFAATVYGVVHVMHVGRGVIRRRDPEEDDRVVPMGRGR